MEKNQIQEFWDFGIQKFFKPSPIPESHNLEFLNLIAHLTSHIGFSKAIFPRTAGSSMGAEFFN
jgi:hypothetical protein